jgi:hypothetical protein
MAISELTLTELSLRHAQLKRQAAETRSRWRTMVTGPRAVATGKRVKALDARVQEYADIIAMVIAMGYEQKGKIHRD